MGDKLRSQTFPVKFPDVSSVKIIRRAKVTCDGAGCSAVLLPVESLQPVGGERRTLVSTGHRTGEHWSRVTTERYPGKST